MISSKDKKISIFMSLLLRHKPDAANIKLDEYGYVKVDELIHGMNNKGYNVTIEDIVRIVEEDDKKRYSFNYNKTKIRANQGHSIKINLELKPIEPPAILYHGTATRFLESIMKDGIKKQKRQYVQLSKDLETATVVGNRHGEPVILLVNCKQMYKDNFKFYLSENNVWMTNYVPSKYIKIFNKNDN